MNKVHGKESGVTRKGHVSGKNQDWDLRLYSDLWE